MIPLRSRERHQQHAPGVFFDVPNAAFFQGAAHRGTHPRDAAGAVPPPADDHAHALDVPRRERPREDRGQRPERSVRGLAVQVDVDDARPRAAAPAAAAAAAVRVVVLQRRRRRGRARGVDLNLHRRRARAELTRLPPVAAAVRRAGQRAERRVRTLEDDALLVEARQISARRVLRRVVAAAARARRRRRRLSPPHLAQDVVYAIAADGNLRRRGRVVVARARPRRNDGRPTFDARRRRERRLRSRRRPGAQDSLRRAVHVPGVSLHRLAQRVVGNLGEHRAQGREGVRAGHPRRRQPCLIRRVVLLPRVQLPHQRLDLPPRVLLPSLLLLPPPYYSVSAARPPSRRGRVHPLIRHRDPPAPSAQRQRRRRRRLYTSECRGGV
eukprot:30975-Pelagococcus_subviridis.AAC.3